MFERCGRDHEIGAIIAESGTQGAPTPRSSQVEWDDPLAVESEDPIQPVRKSNRKARIGSALSRNAALYFTDADDAEEKDRSFAGVRTTLRPSGRAPACAVRKA